MRLKIFGLLLALLVFSACSRTVNINLSNSENSNLNSRNDDVPVTVIIYQLKELKKFQSASEMDLINREDAVLGRDKIDSLKIQLAPQDKDVFVVKINDKEVPYIAALALFANNDKKITKIWVKSKDARGIFTKNLKFEITNEGIKRVK
ncbi:type VI secretion system lipoprotein TssJ [Campylobacter troglodytis]|uniref:type VI secretion system lipoprotein TssJ n=1 Tax=Campylobacter troglodytis TaxID=654363 RepID=UPI00115A8DB3|nr:type VI secretion system lipoprotein TssJ [Campylobacter troglodytis]TQR53138.1 type VI secretion system lipoprotein TssJ [Campylobacter troglodytis]